MGPISRASETPMSQKEGSHYTQNQKYTSGTIETNAFHFMPLCFDDQRLAVHENEPVRITSHAFEEDLFICRGFFNMVSPDIFAGQYQKTEDYWGFDMRRLAQPILSFLYLGPLASVKNHEFMRKEGITLLLAIRDSRSAQARLLSGRRDADVLGIDVDYVDASGPQELITLLPRAIRRINDHIASQDGAKTPPSVPRKVLVFCESGNDRSATVVIAYMMVMFNMEARAALSLAHARRFCISIDEQLRYLLQNFQDLLNAKRDVLRSTRAVTANLDPVILPSAATKKRNVDDAMDHDIDMDESGVLDARKPSAPFQDCE